MLWQQSVQPGALQHAHCTAQHAAHAGFTRQQLGQQAGLTLEKLAQMLLNGLHKGVSCRSVDAVNDDVGGVQRGAPVAEPPKPGCRSDSRKKTRGRQALKTKMEYTSRR